MSDVAIERVPKARLAIWLLVAGELIIFGGVIVCYVLARLEYPEFGSEHAAGFTNKWLGAVNTMILLASSFTIVKAHEAAVHKDLGKVRMFMLLTVAGALVFMVIKLGFEWPHDFHEGHTIASTKIVGNSNAWSVPIGSAEMKHSLFWSYYFFMTGFHGLHVVLGALAIFIVMLSASKGENLHRVEIVGIYWHMVDLLWIFLFPMFYLAQ
jgi:heme/copper-type cytochrome/quinol oxidase subunit 3